MGKRQDDYLYCKRIFDEYDEIRGDGKKGDVYYEAHTRFTRYDQIWNEASMMWMRVLWLGAFLFMFLGIVTTIALSNLLWRSILA